MSNSGASVVLALEEWRAGAAGVLECGDWLLLTL